MTGQWKNRKIQSRADAAELFLEMIRPLKKYYSDGKGWLHVGNTGVLWRKGRKNGGIFQNFVGVRSFMVQGEP